MTNICGGAAPNVVNHGNPIKKNTGDGDDGFKVLREELDGKLESHKHNFEERLLTRSVLCQPKFRCQMDLQKKSIFGTEPAAFGVTCFFLPYPFHICSMQPSMHREGTSFGSLLQESAVGCNIG